MISTVCQSLPMPSRLKFRLIPGLPPARITVPVCNSSIAGATLPICIATGSLHVLPSSELQHWPNGTYPRRNTHIRRLSGRRHRAASQGPSTPGNLQFSSATTERTRHVKKLSDSATSRLKRFAPLKIPYSVVRNFPSLVLIGSTALKQNAERPSFCTAFTSSGGLKGSSELSGRGNPVSSQLMHLISPLLLITMLGALKPFGI